MKKTILLLLSIMFALTACGNMADNIASELTKGNYEKARTLYSEKVQGNTKTENEVKSKLSTTISETLEKYNNGKIKYEDAITLLDAAIQSGIVESWEIENTYTSLSNLNYSKEQFDKGKDNLVSHNYWEAYTNFSNVIQTDANYQNAQKQMTEAESAGLREIAGHVNELVKQKAFDEAYSYIQEQQYRWPNNSALVTEEENFLKRWAESNIADAEKFAASNQFAEAIQQLAMPNGYATPEMYAEIDRINASWKVYSMGLAETAFGGAEKNYQAAINALLETGIDSSVVSDEIAYYESYIPVNLRTFEPIKRGRCIMEGIAHKDDDIDVRGKSYSSCISPSDAYGGNPANCTEDEGSIVYYLNAEYESFSGVLYRPYSSLAADYPIWEKAPAVKIYGDGALLYEAPPINGDTYDSIPIDLDISGVRELKIVMLGAWNKTGFGYSIYYPKVVMAEVWIQR